MKIDSLDFVELGTSPWVSPIRLAQSSPPPTCDVAIIGAGITGLSTALFLAERDLEVVVLDREFGAGATTRSGGIVLGETLVGPKQAFESCEQALAEWIVHQGIACDFSPTGCLELARDARLPAVPINWTDAGRVRAVCEVPGAVLEPVKLLNGLLEATQRAGVTVIGSFDVETIEAASGSLSVIGTQRTLKAERVAMAVDAASWSTRESKPHPWDKWMLTVALQTSPTEPDAQNALGLEDRQPFYTRDLPLLWGRALPDGSFIFGREGVPFPDAWSTRLLGALLKAAGDRLIARVRGLHPRLRQLDVQRIWAGPTARTSAGIPTLIGDPDLAGVVWVGGYGGHGLAQAFRLGRIAGSYIARSVRGTSRIS